MEIRQAAVYIQISDKPFTLEGTLPIPDTPFRKFTDDAAKMRRGFHERRLEFEIVP